MASVRIQRINEEMKKELGQLIQMEVKDPRVGFTTVTAVEVTNDLSHAVVYLSIFGDEEKQQETIKALAKAVGFLRTEIGKRIRLRIVPQFIFKIDKSLIYGNKIEKILSDLNKTTPSEQPRIVD